MTVEGIDSSCNEVQFANDAAPMFISCSGNMILLRLLHPSKAPAFIEVMVLGKTIEVIWQSWNAPPSQVTIFDDHDVKFVGSTKPVTL